MKSVFIFLTLFMVIQLNYTRVLLHSEMRNRTKKILTRNTPRYLVPKEIKSNTQFEKKEADKDLISLDNDIPRERKLFLMTDHQASKDRFTQRMNCKYILFGSCNTKKFLNFFLLLCRMLYNYLYLFILYI